MSATVAAERAELFGHPRGLATLFFTEMCERFSFYGMQALLVLFMTDQVRGGFGLDDQTATAIYGLYTAFVYLVALPGGWIADRLWGARRAIFVGGIIIMCGHFVLAVPGTAAFFAGLMLVVLGTGLLKPNVSAIVGELYAQNDPRRDAGSRCSTWVSTSARCSDRFSAAGWLLYDWRYGFALAGVVMLGGLVQFRLMQGHLGLAGLAPAATPSAPFRRRSWSVIIDRGRRGLRAALGGRQRVRRVRRLVARARHDGGARRRHARVLRLPVRRQGASRPWSDVASS